MSCELGKVRASVYPLLKDEAYESRTHRYKDKIKYYRFKKDEKEEILRRLKEFFEQEERVKLAYTFGGFTRRDVVRDIDVAVYAVPAFSFSELVKLNECECRADVAHICACHSASGHRPCVQIEGIKGGHTSENEK